MGKLGSTSSKRKGGLGHTSKRDSKTIAVRVASVLASVLSFRAALVSFKADVYSFVAVSLNDRQFWMPERAAMPRDDMLESKAFSLSGNFDEGE